MNKTINTQLYQRLLDCVKNLEENEYTREDIGV